MSDSLTERLRNPSPQVLALREYLQTPEGKANLDEFWAEQDAKKQKDVAFFESPEFHAILAEAPRHLKYDYPDRESANEFEGKLWEVFHCLEECYAQDQHRVQRVDVPDNDFGDTSFLYGDYILSPAYGQGTIMCLYYAPETKYSLVSDIRDLEAEINLDHVS
jgi:hypothetical protein